MAATSEQKAQLLAKMYDTPPVGVLYRQVVLGEKVGYIPLDAAELTQRAVEEAKPPKEWGKPTLEQRLTELEARLKALGG